MSRRTHRLSESGRLRAARRGATVVELAFILPVFFFLVYGIVEYGHAQMVINTLNAAARSSARYSATSGVSTADCKSHFEQIIDAAIDKNKVNIMVKDGSLYDTGGTPPSNASEWAQLPDQELSEANPRQMFIIRATVNYNDVALIGMPFLKDITLTGQAISRHE